MRLNEIQNDYVENTVVRGHTTGAKDWLRYRLDCLAFRRQRQSYYQYLADLLHGMRGSRTLRDVFLLDGLRYGGRSWRGRLCARWTWIYELSGGDLYATWSGAVPDDELSVLRSAQSQGNAALNRTLAELAQALALTGKLRRMLSATVVTVIVAVALTALVLNALPLYTVPQLLAAFDSVPPELYGPRTQRLIDFADVIRQFGWLLLCFVVLAGVGLRWSLPHYVGPGRTVLDQLSVWRVYRYMHAQRMLAMLVILLGQQGHGAVQLRAALLLIREGAPVWVSLQLDALVSRLDRGLAPGAVFDTSLFDREQYWFLSDMLAAQGLCDGLNMMSDRLRDHIQQYVVRWAHQVRWVVLIACLATVMGLTLWHYSAIDELRRALINFYAGQ